MGFIALQGFLIILRLVEVCWSPLPIVESLAFRLVIFENQGASRER